MQLDVEFTTEPFEGEGDPPQHAVAAYEVAQAAGVLCDFGPLGTRMSGDGDLVLQTLQEVISTALHQGATRVTVQVESVDDPGKARDGKGAHHG